MCSYTYKSGIYVYKNEKSLKFQHFQILPEGHTISKMKKD